MSERSNLEKALENITVNVKEYRACQITDGNALLKILQQLTATLFYLEKERSEYHTKFQNVINRLVLEGESVARAENNAHKEVPELYMLRHIMTSAYEVVGAIRTTVSYVKMEISNSNNNQNK
jgi:hypothetical protein